MKKTRNKGKGEPELFLFSNSEMEGVQADTVTPVEQTTVTPAEQTIVTPAGQPAETADQPAVTAGQTARCFDDIEIDSERISDEMYYAIKHLRHLDISAIRMIAMESAMIWQNGKNIRDEYTIQSLPGWTLDLYQFIAYYYCSFNMAFPNMMDKVQLPYEKEYQQALADIKV